MYSMMKLRKGGAFKSDVRALKKNLDAIRQAMIQMTGGEQSQSSSGSVRLSELGTYINIAIVAALWLRVTGALDELEKILPDTEVCQCVRFCSEGSGRTTVSGSMGITQRQDII